MPLTSFNWVDIIYVTLLIRICYVGFKNGFLPEFFRVLGLLAAFIFSFNSYTLLSDFLSTHTKWTGPEPDVISFLAIFLTAIFVFKILAVTAQALLSGGGISGPNRLLGLALGLGRGVLLIGLVYTLFVNGPFEYLSRSAKERSFSSKYVFHVAPFVYKSGINFYPWEKVATPLVELLESEAAPVWGKDSN